MAFWITWTVDILVNYYSDITKVGITHQSINIFVYLFPQELGIK